MGYNDKYPDMSAMYAVQFEYENKLKDKIKELETELDRTHKALAVAVRAIETIKYSKKSDAINLRHKANKALIEIYKIKDQTALEQKD